MSHYNKEMVSIYTNTTCNLDCRYCYTNKKDYEAQYVNTDFARQTILDYFSRDEYRGFKRVVRFFAAGEPTMSFKIIKELVAFTRETIGNDVKFELQTNGILTHSNGDFDYDMANWIAKNIDYIWISCDGTPDVQDFYRPIYKKAYVTPPRMVSHEIVEKAIKVMLPICKEMIGVRMTITQMNISRQKEMIQYFYSLGIFDIWADPLFPSVGDKVAIETIDLDLFAKEFIDACEFASSYGVDENDNRFDKVIYGSNYTCNFDEEVKHYCRVCKPVPHATTDGYISSCDMAMFKEDDDSQSSCMNALIYGKWNPDSNSIEYNESTMQTLRDRNCDKMQHCINCVARLHCGGYCLGEVTNETGRIDGQILHKCSAVRYLYAHMNQRQRLYRYSHP